MRHAIAALSIGCFCINANLAQNTTVTFGNKSGQSAKEGRPRRGQTGLVLATHMAALKALGKAHAWLGPPSSALDVARLRKECRIFEGATSVSDLANVAQRILKVNPGARNVTVVPAIRSTPIAAIQRLLGPAKAKTPGRLEVGGVFSGDVEWHRYGWLSIAVRDGRVLAAQADCAKFRARSKVGGARGVQKPKGQAGSRPAPDRSGPAKGVAQTGLVGTFEVTAIDNHGKVVCARLVTENAHGQEQTRELYVDDRLRRYLKKYGEARVAVKGAVKGEGEEGEIRVLDCWAASRPAAPRRPVARPSEPRPRASTAVGHPAGVSTGGRKWRAVEGAVGKRVGPLLFPEGYYIKVAVRFAAGYLNRDRLSGEDWEVRGPGGRPLKVHFKGFAKSEGRKGVYYLGFGVLKGPVDQAGSIEIRLKGEKEWVPLKEVRKWGRL